MNTTSEKRLVLVELNEVNLDYAYAYAERRNLVHLKRILHEGVRRTHSESRYEELEPWIQWVSAHTGKTAAEHGIFRLGDIVGSDIPQFFEIVEAGGYSVGSISAMNAENRLRKPAYFIPDPWTTTPADVSFWSKTIAEAVSQAVNDNAKARLSKKSAISLLAGLMRFARLHNYSAYLELALRSRGAPWRKALFLDLFLHDLHLHYFHDKKPNFSTVFLNAGAHIQHHYLFNARDAVETSLHNPEWYVSPGQDPFAEMLVVYDRILGDYLAMDDVDLIVATGLTQMPYDRVNYYWRLKDHADFMRRFGIEYQAIHPRMTRDFLLEFESCEKAARAAKVLAKIVCDHTGKPIFGEIDNRGESLFVTLTHSEAIDDELTVKYGSRRIKLRPHVTFVAIKNGMHDGNGFVYYKGRVADYATRDAHHVKELFNVVTRYFDLPETERLTTASSLSYRRAAMEPKTGVLAMSRPECREKPGPILGMLRRHLRQPTRMRH